MRIGDGPQSWRPQNATVNHFGPNSPCWSWKGQSGVAGWVHQYSMVRGKRANSYKTTLLRLEKTPMTGLFLRWPGRRRRHKRNRRAVTVAWALVKVPLSE